MAFHNISLSSVSLSAMFAKIRGVSSALVIGMASTLPWAYRNLAVESSAVRLLPSVNGCSHNIPSISTAACLNTVSCMGLPPCSHIMLSAMQSMACRLMWPLEKSFGCRTPTRWWESSTISAMVAGFKVWPGGRTSSCCYVGIP